MTDMHLQAAQDQTGKTTLGHPDLRFRLWGAMSPERDLRRFGWTLDESPTGGRRVGLVDVAGMDSAAMMGALVGFADAERGMAILLGVSSSSQRAVLIGMGFAEVLGADISLEELAVRAKRLLTQSQYLPQFRAFGRLRLDLLGRDAYFAGKPLDLNPREFTLLWRLSDSPDVTVSKPDLIRDVWNMGFIPETNSIAVHMSRLRRKLSDVGLLRIIETCNTGGYRLCVRDLVNGHGTGLYAVPDPLPQAPGVRKASGKSAPPPRL